MSATAKQGQVPLFPPDEKFWVRYSPHHELSLAGMTSFFVHGLVIGILTLGAYWYLFQRDSDTNKPPTMDMVQIAGGGDGFEGMGGEPGAPGDSTPRQTELVPGPMTAVAEVPAVTNSALKDVPQTELDIPEINSSDNKADLEKILSKLEKEAVNQATQEKSPIKKVTKNTGPSGGNAKGVGAPGTGSGGYGKGARGTGIGGGRKLTQAQIYARRWSFNLTGGGKEHVAKYLTMGVTVALLHPKGAYYFVTDLRRRPATLQPANMDIYRDAVQWQNTLPESLANLAGELRLPFVPVQAIILLPKDREQKMADEELRYAQKMGLPVEEIQGTLFDFQLRGGGFEPVVLDIKKR
jgi:hypothetical protein